MSNEDDDLRRGLSAWGVETDPEAAFDQVAARRARRRAIHRAQVVSLVLTVVAGTATGTYALSRVIRGEGSRRPAPIARPTPTGERIAFVSDRDGNDEIYTMRPDGSDVRRLTSDPAEDLQPAWSPDGSRIAFISDRGAHTQIWVMGGDGSHPHPVSGTEGALAQSQIAWTPGQGIAYAGPAIPPHSPPSKYCVSNPCTLLGADILVAYPGERSVSDPIPIPGDQLDPAWGPDGTTIQFVQENDAGTCVLVYDLHSIMIQPDALRRLAKSRCVMRNSSLPATSPVDTRSAFAGGNWIYVSAGGAVQRIARGTDPSWSADGSRLAFVTTQDRQQEISIVGADGSGQHPVTSPRDGSNSQPAWSPPARETLSTAASPALSPSPSARGQAPVIGYACGSSQVTADFDGDGTLDTAVVAPAGSDFVSHPPPCPSPPAGHLRPDFSVTVAWGDGAGGSWPLPECRSACQPFATEDIDGNGTAEFALLVHEGASSRFVEILELPPSEAGPILYQVAPPGTVQHPGGEPLEAVVGGSVTHQDFVTCRRAEGGRPQLITTSAVLSEDQTFWNVTETVFAFDGSAPSRTVPPDTRAADVFTVVSMDSRTQPHNPGGTGLGVNGDPCLQPVG